MSGLINLAATLFRQDKYREAIEVAGRALERDSGAVEAWIVLGSALTTERRLDDALAAMERAVALTPSDPATLMGRASVLTEMKRYDRAIADYRATQRINPQEKDLHGLLVATRMHACDWEGLDAEMDTLLGGIRNGTELVNPFNLLAMPSTAADHLLCARGMTQRDYPQLPPLYHGERYDHGRIRVAYVSGDFKNHPLSHLMAGVFENHDRSQFETTGISFGPNDGSATRARIARSFDRFVDVNGKSNTEIATYLRANEVDLAVDLGAFTTGGRPPIFAMRPAPVQASYLGYPGTTGAPYMDYVIADAFVIPAEQRPDTYYPNDNTREIASVAPTRAAAGLPEAGFVFCSFNSSYKITPAIFDIWMGLLAAVEGSVLWLLESNRMVPGNLRREAAARGISPERLVFAPTVPNAEHLARHRLADLFLDTSYYNAHTTACDALWTGLPLITRPGSTFTSRVAGSLLRAIDLPELIASSFNEYRALALALAREPARLVAIKARLAANRDTTALFDTVRITRHLEAAYRAMIERHRQGDAPAAFAVEPIG